jgi:hypothetical protein
MPFSIHDTLTKFEIGQRDWTRTGLLWYRRGREWLGNFLLITFITLDLANNVGISQFIVYHNSFSASFHFSQNVDVSISDGP